MINWDRIAELQDEVGDEGIAEVIEIFLEEMDEGMETLAGQTDAAEIMDSLHFLKGSAQNIGLDDVSTLCATAEATVRADATAIPDIPTIRAALARAQQELASLTN